MYTAPPTLAIAAPFRGRSEHAGSTVGTVRLFGFALQSTTNASSSISPEHSPP